MAGQHLRAGRACWAYWACVVLVGGAAVGAAVGAVAGSAAGGSRRRPIRTPWPPTTYVVNVTTTRGTETTHVVTIDGPRDAWLVLLDAQTKKITPATYAGMVAAWDALHRPPYDRYKVAGPEYVELLAWAQGTLFRTFATGIRKWRIVTRAAPTVSRAAPTVSRGAPPHSVIL